MIEGTGGGSVEKAEDVVTIDVEWLKLILQAKGLGLNKEEVRVFLEEEKNKATRTVI